MISNQTDKYRDGTVKVAYAPRFSSDLSAAVGRTTTTYDLLKRPKVISVHNPNQAGASTLERITRYAYLVNPNLSVDGFTSRVLRVLTLSDRIFENDEVYRNSFSNELGQIVQANDGERKSLFKRYHANGQVEQVKIPMQSHTDNWGSTYSMSADVVTNTTYDARGRRISLEEPNSGTWQYEYDAADRLVNQIDPANDVTTMAYDSVGRKTSQVDGSATRSWVFDTCGDGYLCDAIVSSGVGYSESVSYDNLGRPDIVDYQVGVNAYSMVQSYDSVGRPYELTYPGGFKVRNHYAPTVGSLQRVSRDSTSGSVDVWEAKVVDHQGLVTNAELGNGVTVLTEVDPFVRNVTSTKGVAQFGTGGATDLYGWVYSYHHWGALEQRYESTIIGPDGYAQWQSYPAYDRNDRMRGWYSAAVNGGAAYDTLGNIRFKSDAAPGNIGGFYVYGAQITAPNNAVRTAPNAVSSIIEQNGWTTAAKFNYDQKAQLTSNEAPVGATVRTMGWKSFGQPATIAKGANQAILVYGPSDQRVRQTITTTSGAVVTDYLNGPGGLNMVFESELANGIRENRHYISAGGAPVAIYKTFVGSGAPSPSIRYLHSDKLGSITAITDETGAIVERLSYDPWGKRQFVDGAADSGNTLIGSNTDRGFTGHEHMDEVGLINMNGRIYDPHLARFASPDLVAQAPNATQSHNRFSYLMNSPMAGTDPTGYFSVNDWAESLGKLITSPFRLQSYYGSIRALPGQSHVDNYVMTHPWLRTTGHAAAGYFGGWAGAAFVTGYEIYISGGSGSDIRRGAARAAVTAAAFYAAGEIGSAYGSYAKVAAHAVVGCAAASSQGGNCGQGAAGAAAGAAISVQTSGLNTYASAAATIIGGGLASKLAGGRFEDGAFSATLGFIFNYCAHNGCFNDRFDYFDAIDAWRNGNGADVTGVDVNELNLTHATYTLNANGTISIHLLNSIDALSIDTSVIYGSLTGEPIGNGMMRIRPDTYNFDTKNTTGKYGAELRRLQYRNLGTYVGNILSGPGTPYRIHFKGSLPVPPGLIP